MFWREYECRFFSSSLSASKGISGNSYPVIPRAHNDRTSDNLRFIERAERLTETNSDLVAPLTRLAEMVILSRLYPVSSNSRVNIGTIGYNRYIHFSSRLGEYQTFIRCFSRSLLYGYTTTHQSKLVNPNHPRQKKPISFIPIRRRQISNSIIHLPLPIQSYSITIISIPSISHLSLLSPS